MAICNFAMALYGGWVLLHEGKDEIVMNGSIKEFRGRKSGSRGLGVAFFLGSFFFYPAGGSAVTSSWETKPYQVLLVVERWNDPASLLVDHQKDEFQPVAALLKAWSVPFDIFRLDQQHLDSSHLLDRDGRIRYGAVIWTADRDSYSSQNLAALEEAVQAGTSLLVVRSRFRDPALEQELSDSGSKSSTEPRTR